MDKSFKCHEWNKSELIVNDNRMTTSVSFNNSCNEVVEHYFLLDTGAVISTMSRTNAESYGFYDINVKNFEAYMAGFNEQPIRGRVIEIDQMIVGKHLMQNVLFYVPDQYFDIAEVLGAGVLNCAVPIPDFENDVVWFIKNEQNLPEYSSKNLRVTIKSSILSQNDELA